MDHRSGWVIVFAAFWINFIVDGSIYSFGPYLVAMQSDLQVSAESVAYIASLQFGFYQICGPMVSVLINLLGFRKVAWMGGTIAGMGESIDDGVL